MAEYYKGVQIAFTEPIREEHAQAILNAVKLISGIAEAKLMHSFDSDFYNREAIRYELRKKLFDALKDEK